jgi:protein gp37
MGENSNIAWTNHSFNPWIGCTKVGPGCEACYAESNNARYTADHVAPNWGPGAPRRRTAAANWAKVLKWDRDARLSGVRPWVFCASLADVFDNEVDAAIRSDLWELVLGCKYLRWQFVTKRIGNAAKMLPVDWAANFQHCGIVATTVTQEECDRDLPKLLEVKRRFGVTWVGLSIEPQLELVVPRDPVGLDWTITGGESAQRGHVPRIYDPAWARALIQDGYMNDYAVFVKQLGSAPVGLQLSERAGTNPEEFPADLRVREMPRI